MTSDDTTSGDSAPGDSAPGDSAPGDTDSDTDIDDGAAGGAQWFVVLDPAWQPEDDDREPPPDLMVGAWFVNPDGSTGPFVPNPEYVPSSPEVPTDLVHAVLRLVQRGEVEADELVAAMNESLLEIAVTESGDLLLAPSPDDVTCALVATSWTHRRPEVTEHWWPMTLAEILDALPPDVDLLVNPFGEEPLRLIADALRATVSGSTGGP